MGTPQLERANALLRSGAFAEAIEVTRELLDSEPGNAEAHNTLGTALAQSGDFHGAERAYLAAAAADPTLYKPHANLANLYAGVGNADMAVLRLREATRLAPNLARLWIRLGQLQLDLRRVPEAERALQQAIQLDDSVQARASLARLYLVSGSPVGAVDVLSGRDLSENPMALAAFAEGCFAVGDERAGAAIGAVAGAALPGEMAARLARIATQLGRLDEAAMLATRARATAPDPLDDDIVVLQTLCVEAAGRRAEALDLLEAAFNARPSVSKAVAISELAERGALAERATAVVQAARVLFPDSAAVLVAWGKLCKHLRDFDGAHAAFEAALQLEPNAAEALFCLGVAEATISAGSRAVELLERACRAAPSDPRPHAALLFAEMHALTWSSAERLERHRAFARRFCQAFRTVGPKGAGWSRGAGRRLRVGYLSGDFRDHAVMRFMQGVLEAHDRSRVELFVYSAATNPDDHTRRLASLDLVFRDVASLSAAAAAALVADDVLDVLVVLDGPTTGSTLRVASYRPAPVIVSYLGYPGTTGLPDVDYRITDGAADPPGAEAHYTERLVRLPHSAWCFASAPDLPVARDAEPVLRFGCYSRAAKLSPSLLRCFRRILEARPRSWLVLRSPTNASGRMRRHITEALGDAATRVEFAQWTADGAPLESYRRIDVALDTFPYSGTTTTAEALWMGVPVVTLAGRTHVERVGASLLGEVGLEDLVATNEDEYVAQALRIADDNERRAELRGSLRARMRAGPLADAITFTRSLEDCLEGLSPARPIPPRGSRIVETDVGAKLVVPESLDTATTFVIIEQGRWFEDEVPFVRELVRPEDVFVDVGANLGVYAIEAACRASRVVAFEPSPPTAARLRSATEANKLTNITIHEVALGREEGVARLVLGSGPELSHIGAGAGPSADVPVRPLAAYTDEVRAMAVLKLDAEGSEQAIVEAAGELLKESAPTVMFELRHGSQVNTGLLSAFTNLGFELFRLCPGLGILAPFDRHDSIQPFQLNLFAVTRERQVELARRGLLATASSSVAPMATEEEARAWAERRPCLATLAKKRDLAVPQGLRYWIKAHDRTASAADRLAAAQAAEHHAHVDAARPDALEARLTAARVSADLGHRVRALGVVESLERQGLGNAPMPRWLFACPLAAYEELESFDPRLHYMAQAIEARVRLGAFSSAYQNPVVLESIEAFFRVGGSSEHMDRRLGLLLARARALG